MLLHMVGWSGSQKDISDVIKPVNGDRNVNPEEMAYWVRNFSGWLSIEYRVGGDILTLKRLIAAGYPVIVEATESGDEQSLNVIEQRSDALGKRQMGESVWIPQRATLM